MKLINDNKGEEERNSLQKKQEYKKNKIKDELNEKNPFYKSILICIMNIFIFSHVYSIYSADLLNLNAININIPIVTYHDISDDENTNSMQITKERFIEDMYFLQVNDFTPLLVEDFLLISSGEQEPPEKPIMITFDDGYISNYEYAFPILQETNMKAIISVIAKNMRDDFGNGYESFMTWEQCREMYESGLVDIENHTYNLHNPDTGGLIVVDGEGVNGIGKYKAESSFEYTDRVKEDLLLCSRMIEENVGNKVKYFAHPYGYTEYLAFKIFEEIGIKVAVTSDVGVANTSHNPFVLERLPITMEQTLEEVLAKYIKNT